MSAELTTKTGQDAIDHMADSWKTMWHGMVEIDIIDPWLKVSRAGADYACYLSLVDGTAVTVVPDDGPRDSDEWVPNDLYPDRMMSDETREVLAVAFGHQGGGSYPLPDEGVFAITFRGDDGAYKALHVGLLDDTVEIVEQ